MISLVAYLFSMILTAWTSLWDTRNNILKPAAAFLLFHQLICLSFLGVVVFHLLVSLFFSDSQLTFHRESFYVTGTLNDCSRDDERWRFLSLSTVIPVIFGQRAVFFLPRTDYLHGGCQKVGPKVAKFLEKKGKVHGILNASSKICSLVVNGLFHHNIWLSGGRSHTDSRIKLWIHWSGR